MMKRGEPVERKDEEQEEASRNCWRRWATKVKANLANNLKLGDRKNASEVGVQR